jgi:hypothetical protein
LDGGRWLKSIYTLSVYLRAQLNLITEMGVQCPKKTNRWVHLGFVIELLIKYEIRIVRYIAEKNAAPRGSHAAILPVLTPTMWLIAHGVSPVIRRISITFVELQDRSLLICQQRQHMAKLVADLVDGFGVKSVQIDAEYRDLAPRDYYIAEDLWIRNSAIVQHIEDQGSLAQRHYDALDNDGDVDGSQVYAVRSIAQFVCRIVTGMKKVQAERDGNNVASEDEAPPVMPADIVKLRPAIFVNDVLQPYRAHLARFWSDEAIYEIEQQHRSLRDAYSKEDAFKKIIDTHTFKTSFNDGWDSIGVRFERLRQFSGGLATIFANTTSVESDFSILKWEKDEFRSALMDLSLEGIFQSKQYEILMNL